MSPCPFCGQQLQKLNYRVQAGWHYCKSHKVAFKPLVYPAFCTVCNHHIAPGEKVLMCKTQGMWVFVHPFQVCLKNINEEVNPPASKARASTAMPLPQDPSRKALYVTEDAPPEVIKASYRALCLLHHPDKGGKIETMQKINAAYEKLLGR
jgi:hypothetical protein